MAFLCLSMAWPAPGQAQSRRSAFWKSLLVPGWGQYGNGRETAAIFFVGTEVAIWGGFFGFRHLGAVRRTHYRTFAAVHAGARTAGKGKEFYDDLGFYESSVQHNRFASYEDGPDAMLYPNSAEYFWQWDSVVDRQRFRDLRNDSQMAMSYAVFTTGFLLANHIVAAIHAARSADEELSAVGSGWGLTLGQAGDVRVEFTRSF